MMFDPQVLLNWAFAILGMLGGFILRAVWTDIREMRVGIENFKSNVSDTYVRRDDYRADISRLEGKVDQIFILLTAKQDK